MSEGTAARRSTARADAARIERALRRLTWDRGAVRNITDSGDMENSYRLIQTLYEAATRVMDPAGVPAEVLQRDRLFLRLFADGLEGAVDRLNGEQS